MVRLQRAIQGAIIFATLFGIPFLVEVYPILPRVIFYSVAFGWVLFVIDSALTFVRPALSYYLGLVLAALALITTWAQPAHLQLIENGDLLAAATIVVGTITEAVIIALVAYYVVGARKGDPWKVSAKP